MEMSGSAQSRAATTQTQLSDALAVLGDKATSFARTPAREKAELLRACIPRITEAAEGWVRAACKAKGLDFDGPASSEEWFGGPLTTLRNVRFLVRSLDDIHRFGKPQLPKGAIRKGWDGRTEVQVMPADGHDKALFAGFSATLRMLPGQTEQSVLESQASFYSQKEPKGGVSLILGAGNVASIPPMDALHKMFTEGKVAIIKLNPVNEYLGPFYEQAFQPLVERGLIRFVYGGADAGSFLSYHPLVEDIHITGSDRTHDLIVWGPPGPERDRRMAENDPLLKKNITSELGCVTPVMVVPGVYTPAELRFVAENIATQMVNNGSFNCNAAKMLVVGEKWPQRAALLAHLREILGEMPQRKAYYPGARARYEALTRGEHKITRFGREDAEQLPWTLIEGLDPSADNEPLFTTEPFCSLISEVALPESDPAAFLAAAARFSNEKLWGTLSCSVIIPPKTEADPQVKAALDRAVDTLRYGAVAINHWAGIVYGAVTPTWGGHPSATLRDIQSGLGFVHNTYMLEHIEKTVLRGPIVVSPKPPWFVTNKKAHLVAQKMVAFESDPSWLKIPGIALTALGG